MILLILFGIKYIRCVPVSTGSSGTLKLLATNIKVVDLDLLEYFSENAIQTVFVLSFATKFSTN